MNASSTKSLPDGWEMRLDGSSNRYYYINHKTKTTQWEAPKPIKIIIAKPVQAQTVTPQTKIATPVVTATRVVATSSAKVSPTTIRNRVANSTSPQTTTTTTPASVPPVNSCLSATSMAVGEIAPVGIPKVKVKAVKVVSAPPTSVPKVVTSSGPPRGGRVVSFNTQASSTTTNGRPTPVVTAVKVSAPPTRPVATPVTVVTPTAPTATAAVSNTSTTITASSSGANTNPGAARELSTLWTSKAKTPFPPYFANITPIALTYDNGENSFRGSDKNLFGVIGKSLKKRKEQGFQGIKNSWKGFVTDRSTCLENVRAERVTLNCYPLSPDQVQWFATNFKIRMRDDTNYWYDSQAGYLGKVGGRAKHFIDPLLPIKGELHPRASFGDSSVLLNGREIPSHECVEFRMWGMPFQAGSRLTVDPEGNIRPEGQRSGPPLWNWRLRLREAKRELLGTVYSTAATATTAATGVHIPIPEHAKRKSNNLVGNLVEALANQQDNNPQQEAYFQMLEDQQAMPAGYHDYLPSSFCSGMVDTSNSSWGSDCLMPADPMMSAFSPDTNFFQDFYEGGMGAFMNFE